MRLPKFTFKVLGADMLRSNNLILSSLSGEDYAVLGPHLVPVTLRVRQCLEQANCPTTTVYFPHSAIISVVAVSKNRRHEAKVGVIGREGMTGLSVVLGTDTSPNSTFVRVAGEGESIPAGKLRQLLKDRASLREMFLRYVHVFTVQAGCTALANARGSVNERLARWLLMAQDRTVGDELNFTHEFLALTLGVRRAGVTISLHQLEAAGLIRTGRASIRILDRKGLEQGSGGLYGAPEAEWERLFGAQAQARLAQVEGA